MLNVNFITNITAVHIYFAWSLVLIIIFILFITSAVYRTDALKLLYWCFLQKQLKKDHFKSFSYGSSTIVSEQNCPQTTKLTLTQTLIIPGGQFVFVAIVWLPPNLKTNPSLDTNPNPNQGKISLRGK